MNIIGNSDIQFLNTLWGNLAIEELVRNNVKMFSISPGSRSTPLTAAAARNDRADKIIIYDERSSAFFALGYAQAKKMAAAVITTSGTAAANLFPAIVEASMSKIPMIILTADRPPELQDVGANQTINQNDLYGKYVKWFFNISCPDFNISPETLLTTIDYASYMSMNSPSGPVHLNFMFREPLEPVEAFTYRERIEKEGNYIKNIKKWILLSYPFTQYRMSLKKVEKEIFSYIKGILKNSSSGLVSIGRLNSDEERNQVSFLAEKLGWPVYADITSGLRFGRFGTNMIKHFDQELLNDAFNKKACPQTLLHFGGPITSKRFAQFFNSNRPEKHLVIKSDGSRFDPAHSVTDFIDADIDVFCKELLKVLDLSAGKNGLVCKDNKKVTEFKRFYDDCAKAAQGIIEKAVEKESEKVVVLDPGETAAKEAGQSNISEAAIARIVSGHIPEGSALFLSSSMPIRDMELYASEVNKNIITGTNRGASGIDGIISTAAGFSSGAEKICTLIIGDIAFIHDLNTLSVIKLNNSHLIIILINNHGGGIFDFLPISSSGDIFEKYFVTPHDFDFELAIRNFGISYFKVDDARAFTKTYTNALKKQGSTVIEVITERKYNLHFRRSIKKEIIETFLKKV